MLNNIAIDHKPLDELRSLFRGFVDASETAILNLDNDETATIADEIASGKTITYSLTDRRADIFAGDRVPAPDGISFQVKERVSGATSPVNLPVPGRHNVENALAALSAAHASGMVYSTG